MYILYILYKIFLNLISIVMKRDKIQNQNLNVSESRKIFALKHI